MHPHNTGGNLRWYNKSQEHDVRGERANFTKENKEGISRLSITAGKFLLKVHFRFLKFFEHWCKNKIYIECLKSHISFQKYN